MPTMKAVRIHNWGGNDEVAIEDLEHPTIGADEVLIRLQAAGVNPVDWKIREGYLRQWFSLPLTLGIDGAGNVIAVGANVHNFTVGDAVYGRFMNTFAEFTTAKAAEIALKPKTLDYIHAAALPVAALTAWNALIERANVQAGQNVLIHAAAGGVGSFGVQFAKARGAYVIGTASANNYAYLCELGTDEFLDYHTTHFAAVVPQVDVILDAVGGETLERSYALVKPGGTLITIVGEPPPEKAAKYGITVLSGDFSQASGTALQEIARLIDTGRVKVHVNHVYPLAAVKQALADSQAGHTRGKLVLQIGD
ncbi:MAG TPA: NADP-dependent oxidoreductase [Phototrophicaceae bacterium]|nr:NADP-dependent oxidoreductase [Phototrophicaceae bacterium]